ncbi:MAG: tetratricopeptide repeat protein [candidate division Zixibacteria bacterium]|nr:tetratricopeptide repeat protein [candidate division Zixibacteria bacterium]
MTKKRTEESIIKHYLENEKSAKDLPAQAGYLLALYCYSKNKHEQSLEELLKAIQKEDQRWDLYQHLVYLGKKSENLKAVYERLNSSMEKYADNHNLHFCLGMAYLLDKKISEAIDEFQKAISLNPDLPLSHFLLGISYLECICASNLEKEKSSLLISLVDQEFSKAKECDKSIQVKRFEEGVSLLGQGKYQQALKEFKQVLEEILEADLVFGAFEKLALYHFIAPEIVDYEMVQQAIQELDQRMEDRENPHAHNRLGVAYLLFLKLLFREAENCFEQARQISPKFQKPLRNLKFLKEEEEEFSNLFEFLRF